jgi:hypothetical protein
MRQNLSNYNQLQSTGQFGQAYVPPPPGPIVITDYKPDWLQNNNISKPLPAMPVFTLAPSP